MMEGRASICLASACFVILCAGFPLTFSLYATSFQSVLGYTQTEVNSINVANILGQFIFYPLVGYCSDTYGANVVASFAALFSIPSLLGGAYAYNHGASYLVLALAFFGIGVGSTCGYITSVSVCARAFKESKGLGMSIPICLYGLATLLFSLVFQTFFSDGDKGYDIPGFWRTIAVFVGLASVVAFFGMRVPAAKEAVVEEVDESAPLLSDDNDASSHDTSSTRVPFFKDVTLLLYAVGYVLIAGSTETLVGNMGSLLQSIVAGADTTSTNPLTMNTTSSQASTAVSIFAICSTVARLLTGVASDGLARHGYARMSIPIFIVCVPMALAFFLLALMPMTETRFMMVVGVNGFCYGAMYCSGPTIAAIVWGLDDFGRNWGVISYSPLIGSVLGSYLYAQLYDRAADGQGRADGLCVGTTCYRTSIVIMACVICVGTVAWSSAWRTWKARRISV